MRAYMRDQFEYFGIATPERRRLVQTMLRSHRPEEPAQLLRLLWALPQREFAYCGLDYLEVHKLVLEIETLRHLITTRSWWDTVDTLAAHAVGRLVQREPALLTTMDRWSRDENLWLRRTALLYQLNYRERTDSSRLFGYVDQLAREKEFFIRKAIGWALRQYARTAPEVVMAFLEPRRHQLSGLSWREATKHLRMS